MTDGNGVYHREGICLNQAEEDFEGGGIPVFETGEILNSSVNDGAAADPFKRMLGEFHGVLEMQLIFDVFSIGFDGFDA